ncbi:MAG: 4a-hydroxytetrahydrobiopterin dehydratase [Deltaproteobacteria bacterium]|nr:4a-hydroxytetrahydrobiopterin dehydratase [Deltaproteobacteria bacterium]
MNKLTSKKCGPCAVGIPPLQKAEIIPSLKGLPGWVLSDDEPFRLTRDYQFTNFKEAMAFVNKVAAVAEEEGHHPNILVHGWKNVRLEVYTHKIGGLHENDFILAAKIGQII